MPRESKTHLEGAAERIAECFFFFFFQTGHDQDQPERFDLGRLRHLFSLAFFSAGVRKVRFFSVSLRGSSPIPPFRDDTQFSVLLPKRALLLVDKLYQNSQFSDPFFAFLPWQL